MTARKKPMKLQPVPDYKRHIVAIGGSLFKSQKATSTLFKYVLSLSNRHKKKPRMLFITTASGDAQSLLLSYYMNAASLCCEVTSLPLFDRTPADLESVILGQDVIFVGGGNTKSMLAVWREYGLDNLLHKAYTFGTVLAGTSAGGICWFDQCLTDSFADSFTALKALGYLKGSCAPHYDQPGRRETFHRLILNGELSEGYGIDECAALHFTGGELSQVVAAVEDANAYRVFHHDGIIEEKLTATRRGTQILLRATA